MKSKIRVLQRVLPFLAVTVSLALVSCDSSKEIDSAKKDEAIGFGVLQSKAASATSSNMASMGVFGYYTSTTLWASVNPADVPKYFDNKLVEKAAGSSTGWTYSPLKYWPESTSEYISFFAYSPHSSTQEDNITVYLDPYSGTPLLNYIVSPDVEDQIDLLYATPQLNKYRTGTPLPFTMNHALTQVSFSVVFAQTELLKNYQAEVSEVSISKVKVNQGTLDLTNGQWTMDNTDITDDIDDTDVSVDYTLSVDKRTLSSVRLNTTAYSSFSAQSLTPSNGYLMLMPQELTDDMCLSVTVITYVGDQEPTEQVTTVKLNDNSIKAWQSGKSINYLITIQGDYISTTTKLVHWLNISSSGNVSIE